MNRTWPTHARRLRENLRAGAICASETEYRALLHETVRESGKAAMEVAKVWFGPDREINKLVVECQGWADVEAESSARESYLSPLIWVASKLPVSTLPSECR